MCAYSISTSAGKKHEILLTMVLRYCTFTCKHISKVKINGSHMQSYNPIPLTDDSAFFLQHRRQASGRPEAKRRTRLFALRLSGIRRRADDLEESRMAQAVLQLRRVPSFLRFDESERRPGRGHLLSRLLQPKLRA